MCLIHFHLATPNPSFLQQSIYYKYILFGKVLCVSLRYKSKVMTYEQTNQIHGLLIVAVIFVFWFLRNTPLGFLWKFTRIFLIVLLITLSANYAKKSLKNWWNKD